MECRCGRLVEGLMDQETCGERNYRNEVQPKKYEQKTLFEKEKINTICLDQIHSSCYSNWRYSS